MDNISVSWGRDYNSPLHSRYEYTIYQGEKVVERKGNFTSSASAKKAGIARATELSQ